MPQELNKAQWFSLMSGMGFPPSEDVYDELLRHYQQSHRHYHNTKHLIAVLDRLDECESLANDKNAIGLALWFHDAIYKIASSTNEKDSADWALSFLDSVGADGVLAQKVYSLIMATIHESAAVDNDERLIVDIDLSILGCSPELYSEFEINIRQEYRVVPWFIYRKKRINVLQSFLDREHIYSHRVFRDTLESQAKANLTGAITKLSSA